MTLLDIPEMYQIGVKQWNFPAKSKLNSDLSQVNFWKTDFSYDFTG